MEHAVGFFFLFYRSTSLTSTLSSLKWPIVAWSFPLASTVLGSSSTRTQIVPQLTTYHTPISDFRESPLRKAKNTRTIVNDDVDGRSTVLQLSMFWLRREARFGSRDPWRSAFCDTTKIIVWSLRHAQVAMLRDTLKSRREAVLRYGVEIWCDCHKGDDLFWFLWVFTFF